MHVFRCSGVVLASGVELEQALDNNNEVDQYADTQNIVWITGRGFKS